MSAGHHAAVTLLRTVVLAHSSCSVVPCPGEIYYHKTTSLPHTRSGSAELDNLRDVTMHEQVLVLTNQTFYSVLLLLDTLKRDKPAATAPTKVGTVVNM